MTPPRTLLALALLLPSPHGTAAPPPVAPEAVAVVYNSAQEESTALARYYAQRRKIPEDHLIGLPLPETDHLSREEYNTALRDPLRKLFAERGWFDPAKERIHVLLCMRGVPFAIDRIPTEPAEAPGPSQLQDEAAVDSELALLAHEGLEIKGALNNPYFKSETPVAGANLDRQLLVGRLDGPSLEVCQRMVDDAVATEEDGLWGMCYLDLARRNGGYQAGEDWIESIARQNYALGIPTVVDRNRDTFVTNYPMRDAALYYGWYIPHRNGPLLNPEFRFKRGAVAVHLHSFSAAKLRSDQAGWCGPLLDKGAAATVGNVFEPFLQLSHHFDILQDRLVQGYSLVEAAHMALPVLSWQNVVLGDPLYRPFARFSHEGETSEADRDYKALRTAWMRWPDDAETRTTKLRSAAARTNSGILYESIGLSLLMANQFDQAAAFFTSASQHYSHPADRLRQNLHRIELARQAGRKQEAITRLRAIKPEYEGIPEALAITGLLNILDPPAPPPAILTEPAAGAIDKPQ